MRFLHNGCGVVVFVVMLGGCHSSAVRNGCSYDATVRTEQQWFDNVRLPYVASEDRNERILKNFDRIAVGSTKDEVVAVLGEPDYETVINPKNPKRSCSYEFHYYVEKPNLAVNVLHDKQVEVYFSPKGNAFWIVSNVNGQIEKGGVREDQ